MKKVLKSLVAIACCLCVMPFATACKSNEDVGDDFTINPDGTISKVEGGKTAKVKFWINGDENEIKVFRRLVNEFNAANEGVEVKMIQRPSASYGDVLYESLGHGNAPDVFYVGDSGYKQYAEEGYLLDITDFIDGNAEKGIAKSVLYNTDEMWDNVVKRYRYNVDTYESGTPEGRYYGVPKDLGPTVIYYNETYFTGAGITVLSVDAADLDDFNAGAEDDRGNTKADLGLNGVTVKEKGYFEANNKKFFNNQVPMNWDETRACAQVVQDYMRSHGQSKGYGYFTEWWFNYGWSVGGNCVQKIPSVNADGTGKGYYNCGYYYDFTLMDSTPNYIVKDDVTEGVTLENGNHYNAGEIISYQDKLDMSIYNGKRAQDGAGMYQNKDNYRINNEVKTLFTEGKLNELPSQKEAFAEFVRIGDVKKDGKLVDIDGKQAYGICPLPSSIGNDAAKTSEFENGRLGMLVDGRWNVTKFRASTTLKSRNVVWDVAPLPMYKEYYEEGDPIPAGKEVGDVKVHGVEAGHSGSVGLCISKKSKLPLAAWKFIEYCGSRYGQEAQAKEGFAIPLQRDLANSEVFLQSDKMPKNSKIFIDATEYEEAGDWWILKDNEWIDDWAGKLNGSVRNGDLTFDGFFKCSEYKNTFGKLEKYTQNR